jgi:hypothetical protein
MDTFTYYFNTVFPLKVAYVKDSIINKWITKGTITSRNNPRLLYNIKRSTILPMEYLKYIQNYQWIFSKMIKEANRREADSFYQLKIKTKHYGK